MFSVERTDTVRMNPFHFKIICDFSPFIFRARCPQSIKLKIVSFQLNSATAAKINSDCEDGTEMSSATSASVSTSVASPAASSKRKRDESSVALAPLYDELANSRERRGKSNGTNEKFVIGMLSMLNNIHNEKLLHSTKARIQLILADAMAESARMDLAESEFFWPETDDPLSLQQNTTRALFTEAADDDSNQSTKSQILLEY